VVRKAVARGCKAPIILLTEHGSYELDLAAMESGASDFLNKGEVSPSLLERSIRYAIERKRNEDALLQAQEALEQRVEERTRELQLANQELRTEIVERRRVEKALRESDERLRAVVQSAPIVLWATDREGRITFSEGRGMEVGDIASSGRNGKDIFERLATRAEVQEYLRRALGGEELVAISKSIGDNEQYFETRFAPHYNPEGKVVGVIGVSTIITERVLADRQIAYQAELIENVNDGVIATDQNFILTAWNKGAEEIYGWTAEETLGKPIWDVIKSAQTGAETTKLLTPLKEEENYHGEAIQIRKDGRQVYIDFKTVPLKDDEGRLTGYVSVNRDVTERRLAEEKVSQNARRAVELAELSQVLAAAEADYKKVLDIIARQVVELLGDNCTITLLTEDGKVLEPVATYHPDPQAQELLMQLAAQHEIKVGEGVAGKVAETGQSVLIPTIVRERMLEKTKAGYRPYVEKFDIFSVLIVPLRVHGRTVGTLGVTRSEPGRSYTEEDQSFLQDVADRAALAISNAQLFQSLQVELVERQKAEKALSASKAMFEGVFESAPDAILLVDHEGRIQRLNQQALAMFGYDMLDLLGSPIETLIAPAYREYLINHRAPGFAESLEAPVGLHLDLCGLRSDGSQFPVDITLGSLRLGKEVRLIYVLRDISERHEIENALRESETRFRTIFESSAIGIALVGLDGKIFANNPILEEMLGYDQSELYQMTISDLAAGEEALYDQKSFELLIHGKADRYRSELEWRRKEGQAVWVRQTMSLVRDDNDRPQFVIIMVENVTERKQMESELAEVHLRLMEGREAERLSLSQELHDGPIQSLYVVSYQAADLKKNLDPVGLEKLATFQESLNKVVQILRTICGELRPPTLVPFGLEQTIRSHADSFHQEFPEIKLRLRLHRDRQKLPERVRMALFRIYQQAMMNIARHAHASEVRVVFEMDAEHIRLEVCDNGRGFEVPSRLIDYVREGHLGLPGISERAEAIGGELEVISAPGKGTRIIVTVPWSDE
jgi:PAS domain S-box-containing protein